MGVGNLLGFMEGKKVIRQLGAIVASAVGNILGVIVGSILGRK